MPYQLLIRDENETTLEELFARGKTLEVPSLPYELDEIPGAVLRIEPAVKGAANGTAALSLLSGTAELNGEAVSAGAAPMRLRNADRITAGGKVIRFYQLHGRPGVSWQANAMSWVARIGVAAALIIELFALFVWPVILTHSDRWRRQREIQEIFYAADALRSRLAKADSRDVITAAWFDAVRNELADRVRYLRDNADELDSRARKEMLANLTELSAVVSRMEKRAEVPANTGSPELNLDTPIRNIIEEP